MSIRGKAYIAGIYEHPTRKADDKSLAQLHAEVAKGALEDAGLRKATSTAISAPATRRAGPLSMVDYLGLRAAPRRLRRIPAARPISCMSATPPRRSPRANAGSR